MHQLQAAGKIRYWGLSLNTFYPEPEADYLMSQKEGQGFQLVFNIINQKAIGLIQSIHEKGYGVIARMPLQFDYSLVNLTAKTLFAKDDHRSFRLNEKIMAPAIEILEEKIWPLCAQYGISKTALALSYILSYSGVSTVIPGIRTEEHVKQNTTSIVTLQAADRALIEQAYSEGLSSIVDRMEKQG
jgi:aryl-alcohol dehydrogenase-like predicted oxidoreductase